MPTAIQVAQCRVSTLAQHLTEIYIIVYIFLAQHLTEIYIQLLTQHESTVQMLTAQHYSKVHSTTYTAM